MGDDILTEDEMIAHAIALSLEGQGRRSEENPEPEATAMESSRVQHPVGTSTPLNRPEAPLRSNTTQSHDSALHEPDESFTYQHQTSQQGPGNPSLRSSPDLGIAAESDVDPMSGTTSGRNRKDNDKSSQESLRSSPESEWVNPSKFQNITLDGGVAPGNATGEGMSHQLPYTRLSSLHDMNLEGAQGECRWSPNKDALELIVGMGISENAAKRALYHTGNDNAELAVSWVFENIGNPSLHEPFEPPTTPKSATGYGPVYFSVDNLVQSAMELDMEDSNKMVLVVNFELKMGVGKIAAQVGHAVLGLYRLLTSQNMKGLNDWESRGARKIVLKGNNTQHLLSLKQKALEIHMPNILVHDAGRTQVDPGSLTVLALFGKSKLVDSVTGNLKLL